jgi:hypothetical protein
MEPTLTDKEIESITKKIDEMNPLELDQILRHTCYEMMARTSLNNVRETLEDLIDTVIDAED